MAIDAYVGLPGHGKSYGVVEHVIIPSLKQGRHVVTNIPLNIDALLMDFGGTIQQLPDDWFELKDLSEYATNGAVLVLDELWRRWPSGMLTNQASTEDKALLAEHRHRVDKQNRSMRIVLVTQDLSQISNWVRVLVESTYRVSKKGRRHYVVSIYNGAVTGVRPPKTALLRQATGRFKKSVFVYYSSATQSDTGDVGDESVADGRASILRSYGLWALVGIMFAGGTYGVYGIKSFFSPEVLEVSEPVASTPKKVTPPPSAPAAQAVQAVLKDIASSPDTLPLSTLWRVAGYVKSSTEQLSRFASNYLGVEYVELTERVALTNGSITRYIPFSKCEFFDGGIEVFCDVDGERVTSWSGSGAVTTVFQPNRGHTDTQQQQPQQYKQPYRQIN